MATLHKTLIAFKEHRGNIDNSYFRLILCASLTTPWLRIPDVKQYTVGGCAGKPRKYPVLGISEP